MTAVARGAAITKVILEIVEGEGKRVADDERTFLLAGLELRVPNPNSDP